MNFTRQIWTPHAARALGEALGADAAEIGRQVREGFAQCYVADCGAHLVTRVEQIEAQAPELVIVAMQGRGVHAVAQPIIDSARAQGIGSIRFHTARPALGRMVRRWGFFELERVYRLDLERVA